MPRTLQNHVSAFEQLFSYRYRNHKKQAKMWPKTTLMELTIFLYQSMKNVSQLIKQHDAYFVFIVNALVDMAAVRPVLQPRCEPSPVRCRRAWTSSWDTRFASEARPSQDMRSMKAVVRFTLQPNSLVA